MTCRVILAMPYPRSVKTARQPLHERAKPLLRGRLHQAGFFLSIPAGLVLVVVAPGPKARVGAIVYWMSLLLQFGASATYHVGTWEERMHARLRTLDHSTIFVLIAGTYTPFCLVVLHGWTSVAVLAVVWGGAAVGVATKLYRVDLHVLSGFMYVGLGWVAVIILPAMVRELSTTAFVLMVTGGVLYTVGALTLATHWPDPFPKVFGYHEVWHTFVVAAGVCHFALIMLLVRP